MASGTLPTCPTCGTVMTQVRTNRWPAEPPQYRCPINHGNKVGE